MGRTVPEGGKEVGTAGQQIRRGQQKRQGREVPETRPWGSGQGGWRRRHLPLTGLAKSEGSLTELSAVTVTEEVGLAPGLPASRQCIEGAQPWAGAHCAWG